MGVDECSAGRKGMLSRLLHAEANESCLVPQGLASLAVGARVSARAAARCGALRPDHLLLCSCVPIMSTDVVPTGGDASPVSSPSRQSRPACKQLQAFLEEIGLEHLQEALWDESLYQCVTTLEAKGRVALIAHLASLNIGPQPVRQKVATELTKARRDGKLGRILPPAWDYVPPMPSSLTGKKTAKPAQRERPPASPTGKSKAPIPTEHGPPGREDATHATPGSSPTPINPNAVRHLAITKRAAASEDAPPTGADASASASGSPSPYRPPHEPLPEPRTNEQSSESWRASTTLYRVASGAASGAAALGGALWRRVASARERYAPVPGFGADVVPTRPSSSATVPDRRYSGRGADML